jgi:putative oxidoreductase
MSRLYSFFVGTNTTFLNLSLLLLRAITGLIVFVAGAGKVFGLFGGYGMTKTLEAYSSMMHISAPWAYISMYTELIGGLLLIIGLFTRPAALLVTINMLVATIYVGWNNFFAGQGDFPFTLCICSFAILLVGPKAYSLDAILFRRREKPKPSYR